MDNWRQLSSYGVIGACAAAVAVGSGCSESVDRDSVDPEPQLEAERTPGTQTVNRPPVADFSIEADLPEDGDPVSFDAADSTDPDGDELTYAWRFGDASAGGGETISHIYTEGGDFEVTLTVADARGASDSTTETVSIKETPFGRGDAAVTIVARDLGFQDLEGVEVSPVGSDLTETTGEEGKATFEQMPTGETLVFEATKAGYTTQVARTRLPDNATTAPVAVRMQPIGRVATVEAIEDGGVAEGDAGARLEFPPGAVVDANGEPVTGDIRVEFSTFDLSEMPEIDGFPGAYKRLRPDGRVDQITAAGAMEVNLKQGGEPVQIKPGKAVEMQVPATAKGVAAEGELVIASLDESTGLWVDEGAAEPIPSEASPTGRVLRTTVTHFSAWVGGYPLTTPCKIKPTCKIVDPVSGKSAPLKSGMTCQVRVTSSRVPGLGNSCQTPEANVSGQYCQQNEDCKACRARGTDVHGDLCSTESDCRVCKNAQSATNEACNSRFDCSYRVRVGESFETRYGDCVPQTCEVPSGMACNTDTLPGPRSADQPNNGVCKVTGGCQGVQYCSTGGGSGSASGSCALPASNGVYRAATGRFNERFEVDPKGEYHSGTTNPQAGDGWLWVPTKDLHIRGISRRGVLHGATNTYGREEARDDHKDGTANKCKEAEPVVPLRHECPDGIPGLKGHCPELRIRHFCEMVFKCPESEYSRSLTKILGTPNVQECIRKFHNDFDIPLLEKAISSERAAYNGDRAAFCLDRIAALRAQINDASTDRQRRAICGKFDSVALDFSACTGVEGNVDRGDACAHDLECRDKNDKVTRGCDRTTDNACLGTCQNSIAAERRCGDTKICNYGEFCANGFCLDKRTGVGDFCEGADECAAGLYCDLAAGECKKREFVATPGATCSRGTSCALGLQCMPDGTGAQVCRNFSKTGGECVGRSGGGTAGCQWDRFCDGDTCVDKKSHGADCEADHECLSGFCRRRTAGEAGTCYGPDEPLSCR